MIAATVAGMNGANAKSELTKQEAERTGWYGKLPSLGDFASRRLSPDLIETWDHWLAAGMAQWREQHPDTWLDDYLSGPSWRFLLMPGLLPGGDRPLAGVLMPSVDRVGRYFPLTLMRTCDKQLAGSQTHLSWLHRLDDLALDAMQEDWDIEQFEAELLKLDADEATSQVDGVPAVCALPDLFAGQTCWWRIGDEGQRLTHCTQGLPQGDAFVALLSGHAGTSG
jgi:type VI secretion system ImpM family protein